MPALEIYWKENREYSYFEKSLLGCPFAQILEKYIPANFVPYWVYLSIIYLYY